MESGFTEPASARSVLGSVVRPVLTCPAGLSCAAQGAGLAEVAVVPGTEEAQGVGHAVVQTVVRVLRGRRLVQGARARDWRPVKLVVRRVVSMLGM